MLAPSISVSTEMANQIKVESGQVLNDEECVEVIRRANAMGAEKAKTIDNKTFARNCKAVWLNDCDEFGWLFEAIYTFVDRINRDYQFEINELETPQYLRYRPLQRYLAHYDSGHDAVASRKLTVVIQLSPPRSYLGGNLRIWSSSQMRHAPRKRGMAVAFPSFCLHQANPVWLGTRHALVTWVRGPNPLR